MNGLTGKPLRGTTSHASCASVPSRYTPFPAFQAMPPPPPLEGRRRSSSAADPKGPLISSPCCEPANDALIPQLAMIGFSTCTRNMATTRKPNVRIT